MAPNASRRIRAPLPPRPAGQPIRRSQIARRVAAREGRGAQVCGRRIPPRGPRIVKRLKADPRGKGVLFELVDDSTVFALSFMHGLVRADVRTRASQVIESVRGYLQSHGGDVALVDVSDDTSWPTPGAEGRIQQMYLYCEIVEWRTAWPLSVSWHPRCSALGEVEIGRDG